MNDKGSPPSMKPEGSGGQRFSQLQRATNAKGTFLRLLQVFFKQKYVFVFVLALTVLSAFLGMAAPYLIGKAIDTFNISSGSVNVDFLMLLLLGLFVMYFVCYFIDTVSGVIMAKVSQKLIKSMRKDFFAKLQKLPLSYFDNTPHGDTMSSLTNDIDNVSASIAQTTTQLFSSIVSILSAFVMMLVLSPLLTVVALATVPLVFLLTKTIAKRSRRYFSSQQKALGELNGIAEESVNGLKLVKAFCRQDYLAADFEKQSEQLREFGTKAAIWSGFLMPIMNVINNLSYALVAGVGGLFVLNNMVGSVGVVVSFLTYSRQFGQPLNNIAGMFSNIQSALAGAERVFMVLDQKEEIPDKPNLADFTATRGDVECRNVSFGYTPYAKVLKDVSFAAKSGQVIAIVGETGSGKTTIVNLLTRFYELSSGNIFIDGVDITDIKRSDLSRSFSVVLQETCLFSGTVAENIRYSKPTASDEDVKKAAILACADDFITRLPDGYNTVISGNYDNFSLGEKQLIAIARAILCPAPILILDEATSSVDTRTEKIIQKALTNLMTSRTSFVIAHRLSTIRDADLILVVTRGEITESGTHSELMKKGGYYCKMVMSQNGK